MNLILWTIIGGLLGGMMTLYFAPSTFLGVGDIFFGLLGALLGGFLVTKNIGEPVTVLKPASFSPGALLSAIVLSVIFLTVFNWLV
jgi:uncharacterized membrane protein YeaQ/YmgE (transglycosylase-associated protein family)